MSNNNFEEMEKWELIKSLSIIQTQQSVQDRKITTAIAKIFEEVTESFENVSKSSDNLANRIFGIELIIAISALAGIGISVFQYIKLPKPLCAPNVELFDDFGVLQFFRS